MAGTRFRLWQKPERTWQAPPGGRGRTLEGVIQQGELEFHNYTILMEQPTCSKHGRDPRVADAGHAEPLSRLGM